MRSKKHLLLFLVFAGLVLNCKSEKKESKEPTQMELVLAIHDEVMPKMSDISKLVGQLKPIVEATGSDTEHAKAMKDLQQAHKSMMDWMQGFGDRFNSEEVLNGKELSAEKQQWLDEEEVKVKALKDQINSSIQKANNLLKEN